MQITFKDFYYNGSYVKEFTKTYQRPKTLESINPKKFFRCITSELNGFQKREKKREQEYIKHNH